MCVVCVCVYLFMYLPTYLSIFNPSRGSTRDALLIYVDISINLSIYLYL